MKNYNYFINHGKSREECGIFGIYSKDKQIANSIYEGLYSLQHRGQEGAGILTFNTTEQKMYIHRSHGLVQNAFNKEIIHQLKGNIGIGHVRYSTHGDNRIENIQPFYIEKTKWGMLGLAHNGNIINAEFLKNKLLQKNTSFNSSSDSELILHAINTSKEDDLIQALLNSVDQIIGAFSIVLINENQIIALRDPNGFRPLSIGRLDENSYCVASESSAFDQIGAELIKSLSVDEYCIINENGMEIHKIKNRNPKNYSFCLFEFIYLSRPDSILDKENVYEIRKNLGRNLAKEYPISADIIVPIPDSGIPAALGYSEASGIPFEMGIMRSHYSSRSFIEKNTQKRIESSQFKLKPIPSIIKNKKIILIDDSIVRGTVSKNIVKNIRNLGAKEIHLLVTAPPIISPCYYGIDTPDSKDLIAAVYNSDIEKIKKAIEVDSLGYISMESLINSFSKKNKKSFCKACFTGVYLTPIK